MILSHNTRRNCLVLVFVSTLLMTSGCTKKSKIESHLKRADAYFQAKDFKKAEIEYLNVLKLDRSNVVAVKRLAIIYEDQGKIREQIRYLQGARELDKDDIESRLKLARFFLAGRSLARVREEAIYVLDRDPKNDEAIGFLADSSVKPEEIADAQERLQKVQAQAADRAPWHLATASLSLRQADYAAAEAALGKALALEPQSSQVQLAWAFFYWMQKDLKNADQSYQKAAELEPVNPAICLRRAEFKISTGSLKEGREILEQFTQKVPEATSVWLFLARIEFDTQDYAECSKIVQRVLEQDRENYQARLLHAGLTRVQGTPADAVKEAEELQRKYKGSPEVEFELALAHLRNQDPTKAALGLQETLKANPEFPKAALLQAELFVRKGDSINAMAVLEPLVQKHPEITRAQLLLGGAYAAQKRFDEALALYGAMEQKFPKVPDIPFLIGVTLRSQNNKNAEARKAFERAAAMSPQDLLVIYQLVDLDILDKDYPAAFERVQKVLKSKPQSGGAKIIEARIFLAQNNLEKAEESLKQALEWEPNSGTAYDLLTQVYLAGKKLPAALENLQQKLTKSPKDIRILLQMAMILEKQGDTAKAVSAYEDVLKIQPEFVPALNNLAFLLSDKLGKYDDALPLATKARELAPQDKSIADTLGWILFRQREYPRALALFQESAAAVPNEPEIQFHLGMGAYMMGQEGPARLAFQNALAGKKEFAGRTEIPKRLALLDLDPDTADASVINSLQDRIREQPDDAPALRRLGGIYERTGAPDKARQAYEDARKTNPNNAMALFQLARLYSTSLKDPQQALALAKEARKLAPEDPAIGHLLGHLAEQSGDHQTASDLLQESARKQPGNPEVYFDMAHAFYALGRVKDAGANMHRALEAASAPPPAGKANKELRPEFGSEAQRFIDSIGLYESAEKRLAAEAEVQQWLKARPDYLPVETVAALIDEQRGRAEQAKQTWEKILAANPQFAPARKQLAGLYSDLGDQQKALELARKARETMTEDPELGKTLGKIAYRRGEFANAVTFLQGSTAKQPADGEGFYFLGMAHSQQKAKEESKRALERALILSPNAAFAPEARKTLIELNK